MIDSVSIRAAVQFIEEKAFFDAAPLAEVVVVETPNLEDIAVQAFGQCGLRCVNFLLSLQIRVSRFFFPERHGFSKVSNRFRSSFKPFSEVCL
jgi:hypothetical protein